MKREILIKRIKDIYENSGYVLLTKDLRILNI